MQIMTEETEKTKTLRMKTFLTPSAISALLLAAALGYPAIAQTSAQTSQSSTAQAQPSDTQTQPSDSQAQTTPTATSQSQPTRTNPGDSNFATGQPLPTRSNEGFWGRMNPFARKRWVNRQLDPVRDRLNELDQLQAKNARDIKDVDARAQAGIHQAQSTADQAGQTAVAANNTANQANQTAQQASTETTKLNTTVSNLDHFQKVNDTEIRFRPGQTVLNDKAKDALDQIAAQVRGQRGYVLEIKGFSHAGGQAGIRNSQHMADAVVRYLASHDVPVYRIYRVALGNASVSNDSDSTPRGSVVTVSVLQNSLAALNTSSSGASSPIGATQ
jgi:outer membrane protein OmpA-like peptidoglycan-associated protein